MQTREKVCKLLSLKVNMDVYNETFLCVFFFVEMFVDVSYSDGNQRKTSTHDRGAQRNYNIISER